MHAIWRMAKLLQFTFRAKCSWKRTACACAIPGVSALGTRAQMRQLLRDGARNDLLDGQLQAVAQFRRQPRHDVVEHGRHAGPDLLFQHQFDAVLQAVEHACDEAFLERVPGIVVEFAGVRPGIPFRATRNGIVGSWQYAVGSRKFSSVLPTAHFGLLTS